jgi:hypothetical protein
MTAPVYNGMLASSSSGLLATRAPNGGEQGAVVAQKPFALACQIEGRTQELKRTVVERSSIARGNN